MYPKTSNSIEDALEQLKGTLISEVLINHAHVDVQVSLAICLSELIRITAPDSPFEDDLVKKAFLVIISSFQNLDETASQSYHKRLRILEIMSKVKSYVLMLDLECDGYIVDIFHYLLPSIKDELPPMTLSYIESILVGILEETDDFLIEFIVSILLRTQYAGIGVSSSAQVLCKWVLETCTSRVQLVDSLIHQAIAKDGQDEQEELVSPHENYEEHKDHILIEVIEGADFGIVASVKEDERCKALPN